MSKQILYLGDTSLQSAASYLAGCLHQNGWDFDYLPSEQPLSEAFVLKQYQLYIVSDYPAAHFPVGYQQRVCDFVRAGSGLLMIGGWESFHGMGGDWDDTPIGDILPVTIAAEDDRRNCDSPVFPTVHSEHPIVRDLPWSERTPLIGGYNAVKAKAGAETILSADRFLCSRQGDEVVLLPASTDPLLVVDESRPGRVTALMTDLAPHWVGPLVDWGNSRVSAKAPGSEGVEVGDLYFQFVSQLIDWTGRLRC